MKLTHTLCSAALLALIGGSVALANTAYAAEEGNPTEWTGLGKIKFREDDGGDDKPEDPDKETDPENPIVKPPTNPVAGPLKVIAVTDLDFDVHQVTPAGANGWEYFAKGATIEYKDGSTATTANFVQFKDTRADNLPNTHTVSAKASKFTNAEGAELKLAELTFTNIKLVNKADASQVIDAEGKVPTTNNLMTDGTTPTTFVTQDDEEKGFGQFILQFGDQTTMDESVKLSIPSANKLSTSSEYTSTITWTIATAR